jgi:hypothetical protein
MYGIRDTPGMYRCVAPGGRDANLRQLAGYATSGPARSLFASADAEAVRRLPAPIAIEEAP